jgi:hypothetical protein
MKTYWISEFIPEEASISSPEKKKRKQLEAPASMPVLKPYTQ